MATFPLLENDYDALISLFSTMSSSRKSNIDRKKKGKKTPTKRIIEGNNQVTVLRKHVSNGNVVNVADVLVCFF